MSARRRAGLVASALLLALVGVPLASGAASAHDALVGEEPAAGSTVTEIGEVTLTFSADPIDEDGADVVRVVGPDGHYYENACPSLAGPVVTTPVELGPSGEYRVEWKVVSSDGHPISDSYTFRYEPAAGTPVATGTMEPACGRPAPTADALPATEGEPSDDGGLWIGLGVGAVVVVGAVIAAWLILRRPRTRD